MENSITLSVEELNRMIDERVQTALANTRPVRDGRMKELENKLRHEVDSHKLKINWYSAWTTIRTISAMRLGYANASKVPKNRYDELLESISREISAVMKVFKNKEEKQ